MRKEMLKQLKSDYEELEIRPSADLWDRIEQGSPESTVLHPQKRFQWLRYAAVLIVLISVGTLLYLKGDHPANPSGTTVHVQVKPTQDNIVPNTSFPQPSEKQPTEIKITQDNVNHKNTKEVTDTPEFYQQEYVWKNKELTLAEKETVAFQHNEIYAPTLEKNINDFPEKNITAKKTDYIKADELLQGREFDKKREENKTDLKKFGALDMSKIRLKSPNSLKILGITIYSDSLESK